MSEEFPEDSFFRNSNVALLEAALQEEKEQGTVSLMKAASSRNVTQCNAGENRIPQEAFVTSPQFITAKQLLLSRGSASLSKLQSQNSDSFDEDVPLLSYTISSKTLKSDKNLSKSPSSKPSKKRDDSTKCNVEETDYKACINPQKPDIGNKDKSKNSYRPLNITRSVVQSTKQSNGSSHDILSSSGSDEFSLRLSSDGLNDDGEGSSSSLLSTQQKLRLDTWGLPDCILQQYAKRGITEMFPWQVECLCCPRVLRGGNLVYSAPTSAGKTLVSEILCIKTVVERRKKVLFVLPFVSVVREKMFYFQEIFRGSKVRVDGYMGDHSAHGGFKSLDLAVCTIEKANSLVNRLMEENELVNLGAVVVDELHLLGDPHRGYLLELLLTKLKYMSLRNSEIAIQLVGMSATLPNLSLLSTWLNADLYKTSYRPVPLEEFIKIGSVIYSNNMKPVRTINPELTIKNDTEDIVFLCLETIADGHSVLIFCPTKSWCESLAQTIACEFRTIGLGRDINAPNSLAYKLREQLNPNRISECLEHLRNCPVGLDNLIGKVVSFAVAYHHAGLSMDERDIIEGSFKNGTLRVLVATSTLSSGVNLPARRVIVRSPVFQGRPIDILSYRQMVGRAGRMGVDSAGESILICQKTEQRVVSNLVSSDLKPIQSCLGLGDLSASLKRALLEVIASGVASTPEDLQLYTSCTLLATEKPRESSSHPVASCIDFLQDNELIRLQTGEDEVLRYIPTSLGQACLSASLHPDEGLRLFKELQRARQCFVLENELHLVYQVTPFNVADQWGNLDWLQVLALWEQLSPDMKRVGELVGIEDRFIVRAMRGTINLKLEKQRQKLLIHRRFYTALALHDLVNEISLNSVAAKFNCSRGMLQSLQQSAATYAGMVTSFCRRLGWSTVELIIDQFKDRLHFGTHRELLDLLRLPSLNGLRARALFNVGITSLSGLATADVLIVENALHSSIPFLSDKGRDDETTSESERRRKQRGIWITGKHGLSEREAAELLISEARSIIQAELGLNVVNWDQNNQEQPRKVSVGVSGNTLTNDSHALSSTNGNVTLVHVQGSKVVRNPEDDSSKASKLVNINLRMRHAEESLVARVETSVAHNDLKKGDINHEETKSSVLNPNNINKYTANRILADKAVPVKSSNQIIDINAQQKSEGADESFQSPSTSLLSSPNNVLDNNICEISNPNESFDNIQSTTCSSLTKQAQACTDKTLTSAEKNKKRNSIDNLFESSFSNSIFARLDNNVAKVFEREEMNSAHDQTNAPQLTHPSELDSCLASWGISNSALGKLCMQEENKAQFEQDESENLNLAIQPSSSKRLSLDLFEVSPHSNLPVPAAISQGLESEDLFNSCVTPTSDRVLRPRNRSGGSSTGKGKGDSPSLLPLCSTSQSPSLFGDSFEMNTGILDVIDGKNASAEKMLSAYEVLEPCTNRDPSNRNMLGDSSTGSKVAVPRAESFVAGVGSSNNTNSHKSASRKRMSEMLVKVSGSSKDLKYSLRRKLDEGQSIDKGQLKRDSDSQRSNSLQLGLSRKGVTARSRKRKVTESEVLTDSFLEAAFQTAFVNDDSIEDTEADPMNVLRENNTVDNEDNILTVCGKRRITQNESSDEDIILSSPEIVCKNAVRNIGSRFAPSSSLIKETKLEQKLFKSNGLVSHKKDNFIGPPLTCRMLATRQKDNKMLVHKSKVDEEAMPLKDHLLVKDFEDRNPLPTFTSRCVDGWDHFNVVDVCQNYELFERFSQEIVKKDFFAVSFACEYTEKEKPAVTIGSRVLANKVCKQSKPKKSTLFVFENTALVGVSFCFGGMDAYYVSLDSESDQCVVQLADRLQLIRVVLSCYEKKSTASVCCFDVKEQYKMLFRCTGLKICCVSVYDPKVGDWLLEPEGKEKNLQAMVVKYVDRAVSLAEYAGHVRVGLGSPALDVNQTTPGRQRSSAEAILCYHIMQSQFEKLQEAGLVSCFSCVEMPVLLCVADIELTGIGFDAKILGLLQEKLENEMLLLEKKAYMLSKRPFSLLSPADTAKVLYQELRLGIHSLRGYSKNTSKETLRRLCAEHPLPAVILLWRKINAIHTKTVCPLLPINATSRLFGHYIMHTATGRISMHEPNIQCIPRDFEVSSESKELFSMRTAFVASTDCVLVAADYSQLELRLLAHLSGDVKLKEALNCGQDVFSNLAAMWNDMSPDQVTDDLRQKTKQLCYGIIYGMGARALANNLEVEESDASSLMETFHNAFPSIGEYLSKTVLLCREQGYVKTLFGRRRYLPGISSINAHVKAHAERQAVNTTVQGSAADLTKTAMIAVEKEMHCNFNKWTANDNSLIKMPRLVLHLHDELMYEVPEVLEAQFCEMLKHTMENALLLSIKLPVKVKVGKSWGELKLTHCN